MTHKIQIDNDIKDASAEQNAIIDRIRDDAAAQMAVIEATAVAKISAHSKLKALGLTDAEIAALVG